MSVEDKVGYVSGGYSSVCLWSMEQGTYVEDKGRMSLQDERAALLHP